jgi:hypothetical protein
MTSARTQRVRDPIHGLIVFEAALGLSIYHKLFTLIQKMEGIGPAPLFHYIVTTFIAPPEAYRTMSWMRLELHGAPAELRLFKEDM